MNEHNEKRKFLFDDSRIQSCSNKQTAGEEFNFLRCANEIFRQGFAALIFWFFCIKTKEQKPLSVIMYLS